MTHETAKKLKDAGFPQIGAGSFVGNVFLRDPENIYPGGIVGIAQEDFLYIPTLEELIEACGRHFALLTQLFVGTKSVWIAQSTSIMAADSEGPTPKEAVSNLWLELNKK